MSINRDFVLIAVGTMLLAGTITVVGVLQPNKPAKVEPPQPIPTASALEPTCGMPPGPDGSHPALVTMESAIAPWQFIGFEESQVGYGVGGGMKQRVISLTDLMPLKPPACLIRSTVIIAHVDDVGHTRAETSVGVSTQRVEDCTGIKPSVPDRSGLPEAEPTEEGSTGDPL